MPDPHDLAAERVNDPVRDRLECRGIGVPQGLRDTVLVRGLPVVNQREPVPWVDPRLVLSCFMGADIRVGETESSGSLKCAERLVSGHAWCQEQVRNVPAA